MLTLRPSSARGHFDHGWLDTFHSFSFARYYDPKFMGFRSLRVINEDTVAPGRGFGSHPHDNMEIITYILSGSLAHKDSMGSSHQIVPGDVQHMSAGSGIQHSEFNPSPTDPVHLMQIWIEPIKENIKPTYDQKHFSEDSRRNQLRLVASSDGADGSIPINADARLYATLLDSGKSATLTLGANRHAWVQLLRGELTANNQKLSAGDGLAISDETRVTLTAIKDAEALVFDLA